MITDGLRQPIRVQTLYDDHSASPAAGLSDGDALAPSDGAVRVRLCVMAFAVAFLVLTGRLAYVTFGMDEEIRLIRAETQVAPRPEVVDRNGRPLAMNRSATGLAIDGRDVWDVEEVVAELTAMFPSVDAGRIRRRLENKQYALVLDSVTPDERQAVIGLGLPGLKFPQTSGRAYPQRDLAAHVVGYTIAGRGGVVGVEKAVDQAGLGAEGAVTLALDVVAQQVLEDELAGAMARFEAKAAWGVLMHATTGEVRALASLPDFNPNRPGTAQKGAWRNRAMSDSYELGSAFKPITAAAALDRGVVSLGETFDVSKPLDVGGWEIKDYSRKREPQTLSEIIQYSSNIGTVMLAQRLGADVFQETLDSLGLTTALQTDLPEKRTPSLSEKWRPSELASSSYGHGIAVTPLQLTAAFAAVVNGGTFNVPRFLADTPAQDGAAVFSDATSAQMRIILRKSITEGTGRNAEAVGYYPIGKTATADKPGAGGYRDDGPLISSFIGAFPGYDPEYVLLVSFDEPQGVAATYGYATAGYVAAPVFRRVVERVAPALGVMPVGDEVAFDGFVGLRRETDGQGEVELDALAALLAEASY